MDRSEEILKVLQEMRDSQREHLEEYRRIARQTIELQQTAVGRQKQATDIYKGALVAGALLVVVILALIIYLLQSIF